MKKKSLIEDDGKDMAQRAYTHQNPQKAHPTGEFVCLLWHEIVALQFFLYPLAL